MEEILQFVHDLSLVSLETEDAGRAIAQSAILHSAALQNTETPLLDYNNETELTAIVNLVYLSARDSYYVERENKAGEGYVDFIFYPENIGDDGIILELKVDDTPETAIEQIIKRKYKVHHCKIEYFNEC